MPVDEKAQDRVTGHLQRCRAVWGRTERIAAPPALAVVAGAIYRPVAPDGTWALRTADGAVIEAAGAPPVVTAEREAEDRPTLYLGPMVTHYGHFLVGTLARLWPLLAWEGARPRLLCHGPGSPAEWRALPFLAPILARFGLGIEDLVCPTVPTRVPCLHVPAPALREQAFAHAVYGDLARAIGRPFWEGARVDSVSRPVYLAKTRLGAGISRLRNEEALCAALARGGVDIVHPEELAFGSLVRLLSERRIVMGTTGSAFHTAVFAAPGRRILGLNWAPHLNANFPLLDALNGTQARYYHPLGSESAPDPGFHFGWSVPDPKAVAAELLWRAERFEDLDRLDGRAARGPVWRRVGRWLRRGSSGGA